MSYVDPRGSFHEESREPLFIPRITPQPPPSVAVDDPTDAVCVRINAQWVKHVAGYLYGLTRFDAWDGTEEEVLFARQQAMNLLSLLRKGSDCEASMSCQDVLDCLDDLPAWQAINQPPAEITMSPAEIQQFSDEQHTERDMQYDGTPQSIMTDSTNQFNSWIANPAIEEAITAFVIACFEAKIAQMRQIEGLAIIANLLFSAASYLSGGGWLISGAGWGFLSGTMYASYNYSNLYDALTDEETLRYTVLAIYQAMNTTTTKPVNFTNFKLLPDYGNATTWAYGNMPLIRNWLRDEIFNHPLNAEKNYLLLLDAINTANYHLKIGDPMWRGWNDDYVLKRGAAYSMVGAMSAYTGTLSDADGFVSLADGDHRRWYVVFTSTRPFQITRFNAGGLSAAPSPVRPTQLSIKNDGVETWYSETNFPNTGGDHQNIVDGVGKSIRFTADFVESGGFTMPPPYSFKWIVINGDGKPPTGYWTPD